jgi:hypothetical protein
MRQSRCQQQQARNPGTRTIISDGPLGSRGLLYRAAFVLRRRVGRC